MDGARRFRYEPGTMSPPDRLRILHVMGGVALDWGGPSRVVREMATHLGARGHEVVLLATDVAPGRRRAPLGAPGQPLPDGDYRIDLRRSDMLRPPYVSLAHTAELWRVARAFDVAHVHGVFNAPVTAGMMALRRRGVPYIVRACGMLDPWSLGEGGKVKGLFYRAIERPNLRAAGAIQVSTPHEERAVAALALGVPIACLPQGVGRGPPAPAEAPWPRPYVLSFGRVARKKGLALLIDALVGLDVDLVIVGPDELGHRAELEARAAGRRVHFAGAVREPRDKAAWYAHARAFALPSADENFGIAVVEAAQHGTPVVVSDQVGLAPHVLMDGAGLVVPREVSALHAALTEVLARGRAAYADGASRLAARFDWERLVVDLEALYRRVARARARGDGQSY